MQILIWKGNVEHQKWLYLADKGAQLRHVVSIHLCRIYGDIVFVAYGCRYAVATGKSPACQGDLAEGALKGCLGTFVCYNAADATGAYNQNVCCHVFFSSGQERWGV